MNRCYSLTETVKITILTGTLLSLTDVFSMIKSPTTVNSYTDTKNGSSSP